MLTRRRRSGALAAITAALIVVAAGPPAAAEVKPDCNKRTGRCVIDGTIPGTPGGPASPGTGSGTGSGDGTSTAPVCKNRFDEVVPCHSVDYGWFNPADGCYYQRAAGVAADDPAWGAHAPGDGQIYRMTCLWPPPTLAPVQMDVWLADPPPGFPAALPTPETMARRALAAMGLKAPAIGIVPEPGPDRIGLVGMPVWMWNTPSETTWGPITRTASAPGISVTGTAHVTKTVWEMGDGTTVECTTPGTPYEDRFGDSMSPDCGHRYTKMSASGPDHAYTVTATNFWVFDWAGGGKSGQIRLPLSDNVQIRVGEVQVIVK